MVTAIPATRTCTVPDCGWGGRLRKGLCNAHYFRLRRNGSTGPAAITDPRRTQLTCTIDRCHKPHVARGLCGTHYSRVARYESTARRPDPRRHDVPSYHATHNRLRREKGSATNQPCVDCGGPASAWSYNHDDPAQTGGTNSRGNPVVYSTSLDRYSPRCSACHNMLDRSHRTR